MMTNHEQENLIQFLVKLKEIGVVKYETQQMNVEFRNTVQVVEVPPPDSAEKPRTMTEDELLFMSAKD